MDEQTENGAFRRSRRISHEEIGFKISGASIAAGVIIIIFWAVINATFVASTLRFENQAYTLFVSFILTIAFPAIAYKRGMSFIRKHGRDILQVDNLEQRGKNDRQFVIANLFMAILGLAGYLGTPFLASGPTNLAQALAQNAALLPTINAIYMDLIGVCSFGIFAGSIVAAYFRYNYPRSCLHCGYSRELSGNYCSNCGESIDGIISRKENFWKFVKGERQEVIQSEIEDYEQVAHELENEAVEE
jgi:hypothetical protein